jgi:hypothetical protein
VTLPLGDSHQKDPKDQGNAQTEENYPKAGIEGEIRPTHLASKPGRTNMGRMRIEANKYFMRNAIVINN